MVNIGVIFKNEFWLRKLMTIFQRSNYSWSNLQEISNEDYFNAFKKYL